MEAFPLKTSFWFDERVESRGSLTQDRVVDVAIVGGGFAGLSSAIDLKQSLPDLQVAVLEANHVGFGASGRNAGWLSSLPPLIWFLQDFQNSTRLEEIQWTFQFIQGCHAALKETVIRQKINCDWKTSQHMLVARNTFEEAVIRWMLGRFQAVGVPCSYHDRAEVRQFVSYPAQAALSYPVSTIHPYQLVRGLCKLNTSLGVDLYENTRIVRIESDQKALRLITDQAVTLKAEKVILATNAYDNWSCVWSQFPKTRIVHTYMLATEPLDRKTRLQISQAQIPFGDPSLSFFIGRIHQDQFLFNGIDRVSKNTIQDDRHRPSFMKLHREMLRRFPFLEEARIAAAWGGATRETITDTPIIQKSPENPNIIFNLGYGGGIGIGTALASGRLTTDLVLGKDSPDRDAERLRKLFKNSQFPVLGPVRAVAGVMEKLLVGSGL